MKTLKRIGCRVQTKGISPANDPSPSPFPFFLYPSDYYPTDYFSQIYQEKSFPWIPHSRFSIFNSGKQISTFSKFRFAIPRGRDPILYGGGKKEERRWNTRAHQLIWYTIMLLYLIISQTRPRAEFRINEEKETAPRFVLSWISHFIKSENVERERERDSRIYAYSYRIDPRKNEIRPDVIRFRTHNRNLCSRYTIRV